MLEALVLSILAVNGEPLSEVVLGAENCLNGKVSLLGVWSVKDVCSRCCGVLKSPNFFSPEKKKKMFIVPSLLPD